MLPCFMLECNKAVKNMISINSIKRDSVAMRMSNKAHKETFRWKRVCECVCVSEHV